MNLSYLFDCLRYGELSKIFKGDVDDDSIITPAKYNKIITALNMALTSLYSQLEIKTSILLMQATEGNLIYKLHSSNALSITPTGFILDSVLEPFGDDIISLTKLFNEAGEQLPLGTGTAHHGACSCSLCTYKSIRIMRNNTIMLPDDVGTQQLKFYYKANHPKIPLFSNPTEEDMALIELELDEAYLEAVLFYIAARMYAPVQAVANVRPEGDNYMMKYKAAIQELRVNGIAPSNIETVSSFQSSGFV